jgi:hypothetical protein
MKNAGPTKGDAQRTNARRIAKTLNELRVLDAILDFPSARQQGYTWETNQALTERAACFDGGFKKAMKSLKARGVIRYQNRRRPGGRTRRPVLLGPDLWPPGVPYLPDEATWALVSAANGAPIDGWPEPSKQGPGIGPSTQVEAQPVNKGRGPASAYIGRR